MKHLLITLTILMSSALCGAQDKPDLFEFLETFDFNISTDEFKERYSDRYHPENSEDLNSGGMFIIDAFTIDGRNTMTVLYLNGQESFILIKPEGTESLSKDELDKSVEYFTGYLGNPDISRDVTDEFKIEDTDDHTETDTSFTEYQWDNSHRNLTFKLSFGHEGSSYFYILEISPLKIFNNKVPVQRKFFKKLTLGKYVTRTDICEALDCYHAYSTKTSEGVKYEVYSKLAFGGYDWSSATFYTTDQVLYRICFINNSIDSNHYIFENLIQALSNKYGLPFSNTDELYVWTDGVTVVALSYIYGESISGEMRHYVNLEYYDLNLKTQALKTINDQL